MKTFSLAYPLLLLAIAIGAVASPSDSPAQLEPPANPPPLQGEGLDANGGKTADFDRDHLDEVMTSRFCASCHPAIYAEHAQNTHGRAFTDEEVRLATGRFDHGDCIRCHTPRPVFETGIGMNPIRRHHNLEEGNTCMTCHWKEGVDYAKFQGGGECITAFDDRVGEVEACASCHRNHGTPYQWAIAPTGKLAGNTCVDCHMAQVTRPVAVGEEPRQVRTHNFPGSRSERQLRKAYRYSAEVEGNEVVVRVTNRGAGHHFPTELKQRSVESVIIVRDIDGKEVARSRMIFRDPYKRPYGLTLPVNTQIPPGETREHRVPIGVAAGTVDAELHFKLYFPIEDHHPELARMLESTRLVFEGVDPSDKEVTTAPDVRVTTPESVAAELASPANLVDFARPPIGTVEITVPEGSDHEAIGKLIELFQFPVPEGNSRARDRLVEIGAPAIPQLVEAMGSWDNKTWNQAMAVLEKMGEPTIPAIVAAMESDQLYIRCNARELLSRMGWLGRDDGAVARLIADVSATNGLDRSSAADLLGTLRAKEALKPLVGALADRDPDVVRSAALALARMRIKDAIPAIQGAMAECNFVETKIDLAVALGRLGDASGIPFLLATLDHPDDLIREDAFESFFGLTRLHLGYEPLQPYDQRLASLSRLQAFWAREGGDEQLRPFAEPSARDHSRAWHMVSAMGGADDDAETLDELVRMGDDAIPALIDGLKFPAGFADKRVLVCEALGRIGSLRGAPALSSALRDPVVAVSAWACWALEQIGDSDTQDALMRYRDRILTLESRGQIPANVGSSDLLNAQALRAGLSVGDATTKSGLVRILLSDDVEARRVAIDALEREYGDTLGYDPEGDLSARRAAVSRWLQ